jgi:hypothetical protein
MENYYAQVILASDTGASKDVSINTFAIACPSAITPTISTEWRDALIAFYNAVQGAGGLHGRAKNGHVIKQLKAATTKPNYPLYTYDWNLTDTPQLTEMPQEVALCVSYANDSTPLVPRARRRGRIYISGWGEADNASGRPNNSVADALATAYADYADAVYAIGDAAPGVWSRSTGDVFLLDRVYCDNEWDTMRSRGGKSTYRKTISLA